MKIIMYIEYEENLSKAKQLFLQEMGKQRKKREFDYKAIIKGKDGIMEMKSRPRKGRQDDQSSETMPSTSS